MILKVLAIVFGTFCGWVILTGVWAKVLVKQATKFAEQLPQPRTIGTIALDPILLWRSPRNQGTEKPGDRRDVHLFFLPIGLWASSIGKKNWGTSRLSPYFLSIFPGEAKGFGGLTSASDPRVQSDTLQKWTDHALHTSIRSPNP
jgi:hypothetical protein